MMRAFLHMLLVIMAIAGHAQVLVVLPEAEEPNMMPHFNEQFIKRNRIAAIHGEQMVKPESGPMHSKKEKYLYRFDEQGRMIYRNSSFGQPGTGKDTASTIFTYDEKGRLVDRLRNDLNGHFGYRVERNEKDQVVRETYSRIVNLSTDRYVMVPGTVTEITDEHFRYEQVNDTIHKKIFINDLDLPFREQTFTKDTHGYLRTIEDRYLVSNRRSRITFNYDENGNLAERIDQPDVAQQKKTRRTWKYDKAGNVLEGELWHDDVQVHRQEFLYEETTMMLKARLTKDMATNSIHVVRFRTEHR
jgi:hypothetical protein